VYAKAESDVLLNGKMWEKGVILRYISNTANTGFEVRYFTPIDIYTPRIDLFQAAKALQKDGLS
jgi:hypothetical protein